MKKLLSLTLSLASIGFVASSAEAKASGATNSLTATSAASAPATVQWRRNDRRNYRRIRTVTQSRLVRVGRRIFRETYQITYLPNGGTRTRLISRVRVR